MAYGPYGGQQNLEPVDLMTHLKAQYMARMVPQAGQPAQPSCWDDMKAALGSDPQRIRDAAAALKHFIECSQFYLARNQPQNMHYLAAGVGLQLDDGSVVTMTAPQYLPAELNAHMQPAGDIPVSKPQSQYGQFGIVPTHVHGITGTQGEYYQQVQQAHGQQVMPQAVPHMPAPQQQLQPQQDYQSPYEAADQNDPLA